MAYTDKQIIDALQKCEGNISAAARSMNCDRSTIHKRINSSEKIKEAYTSVNESTLDRAENALIDLIKDPEHKDHFGALRFYLRTKGKSRDYTERQEIQHNTPIPVKGVNFEDD